MLGIAYLIGYIWFWRYHAGIIAHDFKGTYQKNLQGDDIFAGIFFGTMACAFWPLTVPGRLLYVAGKKYEWQAPKVLFPEAKPIETKTQRQARKQREQEKEIAKYRSHVNERERELGLTPTKWS